MEKAELTFLGTGTSQGIPIIGCRCPVCRSADPADKRMRCAALVRFGGLTVLVDAGPDFRMQMLREDVSHLDAILLTHNHKDHTGGLDDVRSLNYIDRRRVEIYCEDLVLDSLRKEYAYAFSERRYPGAPEWRIHRIGDRPFTLRQDTAREELVWVHDAGYSLRGADGSLRPCSDDPQIIDAVDEPGPGAVRIIPIRGYHDQMPVLGFRFGNIAYITDMSRLPDAELAKLQGLDHVTLNTVGYREHHSHFSLDQALTLADRIGARHTWLTHLSHTFPPYQAFCAELERLCSERGIRSRVRPAYDGLVLR